MFLLIDGYNVLHLCGFIGRNVGPGSLRKARGTLLGELARRLTVEQRKRTTIVFDSADEFSHLESTQVIWEMQIEFASDHAQADDRIEQMISRHSAPKQLTVVSSDRRLQLAAKRRGAKFANSEDWLDSLSAVVNKNETANHLEKPLDNTKLSDDDVRDWIEYMGLPKDGDMDLSDGGRDPSQSSPKQKQEGETYNPFPPGYGDDLLDQNGD